jgi:uracil-DNA glycosylase
MHSLPSCRHRTRDSPNSIWRTLPQGHSEKLLAKKVTMAMIGTPPMPESQPKSTEKALEKLCREIIRCRKCPRLVRYREAVAREKRAAFRDWEYWGKPVPGFGDPHAQLLILGLAPAAHGANRTGRMFTGDRSGDFLYQALYRTGFANQPTSKHRDDGLELRNAYIAAAVRCAPPDNKPLPAELANCRPYFERELDLLRPKAILALGSIAMRTYLGYLKDRDAIASLAAFPFGHAANYRLGDHLPRLFASYHPSQQNTFTGKLTEAMLESVLAEIRAFLAAQSE